MPSFRYKYTICNIARKMIFYIDVIFLSSCCGSDNLAVPLFFLQLTNSVIFISFHCYHYELKSYYHFVRFIWHFYNFTFSSRCHVTLYSFTISLGATVLKEFKNTIYKNWRFTKMGYRRREWNDVSTSIKIRPITLFCSYEKTLLLAQVYNA